MRGSGGRRGGASWGGLAIDRRGEGRERWHPTGKILGRKKSAGRKEINGMRMVLITINLY